MHSIPFAFLCGELTYLLFISDYDLFASISENMPFYSAMAVFAGFFTHLAADAYNSRKKKDNPYAGTCLVFWSDEYSTVGANIALYVLIGILFLAIQSHEVSFQSIVAVLVDLYEH